MLCPKVVNRSALEVEYLRPTKFLISIFQTRREDHQEDNHDGQQDEGAGHEGDLLQVSAK